MTYTDAEFEAIAAAARLTGLTPTGYTAEAAASAARGAIVPALVPARAALLEVVAARTQVRRFGVNVNQAVRALNSTAQAPEWLRGAVTITTRTVQRLDAHADDLTRLIMDGRGDRQRRPRTCSPRRAHVASSVGSTDSAADGTRYPERMTGAIAALEGWHR